MKVYFFDLKRLTPPLNAYPNLEEFLALRALGHSYTMLSDRFNVPKTTVRYICRKFGYAGNIETIIIRKRTTIPISKPLYTERINEGKTYAQYLQAERDRKWKRLTESHLKHAK